MLLYFAADTDRVLPSMTLCLYFQLCLVQWGNNCLWFTAGLTNLTLNSLPIPSLVTTGSGVHGSKQQPQDGRYQVPPPHAHMAYQLKPPNHAYAGWSERGQGGFAGGGCSPPGSGPGGNP